MGSTNAKLKPVSFPEDILEQLRCFLCKGHLSCSPIRLLPNGSSACGRCSVTNYTTPPVVRQLSLEVALSRATFPCCYKQYGCPEKLMFGHTIDHEAKCPYHPFACPSLPSTTCSWQGSAVQVRDHFYKSHPYLLRWSAEFHLVVHENKEDILMIIQDDATFMLKYVYDAVSADLQYDVRYFAPNTLVASYKVRLLNSSNPDYNLNLKGNKCLLYNSDMAGMRSAATLTLSKLLEALENPHEVTVELQLPLLKTEVKTTKIIQVANYDQLDSLRCAACQHYLALPIFDTPTGSICADCSVTNPSSVPSQNQSLHQLVSETNYPCRWNDCKFIAKGHSIRLHEDVCPHKPYVCPSLGCKIILTIAQGSSMQFHLMISHGYLFFPNRIVYTTKFTYSDERVMVTTSRNNEIIVIKHQVDRRANVQVFTLRSSKTGLSTVVAYVYFEHSHCKIKSRRFVVGCSNDLKVTADMLPKCYRSDKKMSVVIEK